MTTLNPAGIDAATEAVYGPGAGDRNREDCELCIRTYLAAGFAAGRAAATPDPHTVCIEALTEWWTGEATAAEVTGWMNGALQAARLPELDHTRAISMCNMVMADLGGGCDYGAVVSNVLRVAYPAASPDPPDAADLVAAHLRERWPCTCRPGMDGGGVYHAADCNSRREGSQAVLAVIRLLRAANPPASPDERLREALRDLAEAARPYVERAAPDEKLWDEQDYRNFLRLSAALAAAVDPELVLVARHRLPAALAAADRDEEEGCDGTCLDPNCLGTSVSPVPKDRDSEEEAMSDEPCENCAPGGCCCDGQFVRPVAGSSEIIERLRKLADVGDEYEANTVFLADAEAAVREAFAAGRAAATPDPAETDTRGGGDASSVPDQSPAASPDERLREALRDCSATLLTVAPILEAHWYEANASGHAWNAWTRWGERTLERIEAVLAAADREAPDPSVSPEQEEK